MENQGSDERPHHRSHTTDDGNQQHLNGFVDAIGDARIDIKVILGVEGSSGSTDSS